jgi:hypothetical protein
MATLHSLLTVAAAPSGTGDVTVIAAQADKTIHVQSFALVASAATVFSFKSGGADISGGMSLAQNGGVALCSPNQSYLFKGAKGASLVIAQTVDGVDGFITYYLT